MNSRHHSSPARTATQPAPKLPSTTSLIETLSDQLDYLQVSTKNTSADLLTTNTANHAFEITQSESKRPWSDSKITNNRHSPAKRFVFFALLLTP
jgi:hypothetical protein